MESGIELVRWLALIGAGVLTAVVRALVRSALSWRTRGLVASRRSLGSGGDARVRGALQRELDIHAFHRLAGFRVASPAARDRFIELNERYPDAASWTALRACHDQVDLRNGRLSFKRSAPVCYRLNWLGHYGALGLLLLCYAGVAYFGFGPDIVIGERLYGIAVSMIFLVPAVGLLAAIPHPRWYPDLKAVLRPGPDDSERREPPTADEPAVPPLPPVRRLTRA